MTSTALHPTSEISPSRKRTKLLLVDDEPSVLLSLREILKSEGYEVFTAATPHEALGILQTQSVSLVMSDQRMPGMTGLDLLARVEELQPHATRILITGVLDLSEIMSALNRGQIYRFVVKPWIREELLVTVRNGIQRSELVSENEQLRNALRAQSQEQPPKTQVPDQTAVENSSAQLWRERIQFSIQVMHNFYAPLAAQAKRVFELCRPLAEGLNLPAQERVVFESAAWLHDIGLIATPRRLVRNLHNAPQQLTPADWEILRQHPGVSAELAESAIGNKQVAQVVRAHHERFDGRGFPDGLSGESIPWLARLLSVAIAFAERGHSDYDPEGPRQLWNQSGKILDPEAVRVFLRYRPRNIISEKEREILLSELRPGMVLARSIYGANGLLLIPEGQILNQLSIEKLQNHNRTNPINQSLVVFC